MWQCVDPPNYRLAFIRRLRHLPGRKIIRSRRWCYQSENVLSSHNEQSAEGFSTSNVLVISSTYGTQMSLQLAIPPSVGWCRQAFLVCMYHYLTSGLQPRFADGTWNYTDPRHCSVNDPGTDNCYLSAIHTDGFYESSPLVVSCFFFTDHST